MVNIPGVDYTSLASTLMYWLGYGLIFLLVIAGFVALFILMNFKYKVQIFEKRGSGNMYGENHSVGKIKNDRAREVKENGVTKWKLLFNKDKIPPIDYEHIYPGDKVFLYKTGPGSYFPIKFTCSNPNANFTPIDKDMSFWTGLELKQVAEEYQKPNFMEKYGNLVVMSGTVLFCLILVGVTVYYTYQHANGVAGQLGGLTSTLKDIGTIGGIGPQ